MRQLWDEIQEKNSKHIPAIRYRGMEFLRDQYISELDW